jgi:hypothetical protein
MARMNNDPAFPANRRFATTSPTPTHNQIAAKAYELWLQNGPHNGRCIDYWFRAEELLIQELNLDSQAGGEERMLSPTLQARNSWQ